MKPRDRLTMQPDTEMEIECGDLIVSCSSEITPTISIWRKSSGTMEVHTVQEAPAVADAKTVERVLRVAVIEDSE